MTKKSRAGDQTAKAGAQWVNRITGSGDVDPQDLLANPKNWAIHPSNQQDALLAVLKEIGWVGRVMVNKRTGFVVDGHARVALALREQQPTVPVDYVELDEREENLVLATFDMITRGRVTDTEKLKELLSGLEIQDPALRSFVEDFSLLERIDAAPVEDMLDAPTIEHGQEYVERWGVEYGQLWQLGAHRVLVDDATIEANLNKLMGGGGRYGVH